MVDFLKIVIITISFLAGLFAVHSIGGIRMKIRIYAWIKAYINSDEFNALPDDQRLGALKSLYMLMHKEL